jgi:dihydropteroate synthase
LSDPTRHHEVTVALAIGGNLGDRAANLRDAVRRLVAGGVQVDAVSSLYETPPWGYADQPSFLNGALRGRTTLAPHDLLTLVKRIEQELGREPSFRNAPRPVDIDIALYGDCVINEPGLHVPHPGLPERAFVLVPLAEVAGAWMHPTLGTTIAELRAALGPADEIKPYLAPARWAYITPEMDRSREAAEIVVNTATHPHYPARLLALHTANELHAELRRIGVDDDTAKHFSARAKKVIVQIDGISRWDTRIAEQCVQAFTGASCVGGDPQHATLLITNLPPWFGSRRGASEARDDGAPEYRERIQRIGEAAHLAIQRHENPPATVAVRQHTFDWANRVEVMGILNATPDSFSDAGKYFRFDDALRRAHEMAAQGATMIEVGGQSAQPGPLISVDEELCRIVPLLERLRDEIGLPLAVDTFRVGVARGAVAAGAVYINDIGGGGDADMARLAAETGVLLGIMHLRGKPKEKQWDTNYESVMDEVTGFLHERIGRAVGVGVAREKIVIDPGLGFGKEAPHDLDVMHRFSELRSFGLPILLATSRKNYLSDTMGRTVHDLLPETAAMVTYGIAQGANIIRVHDVAFMARIAQLMPHILRHTAG